MKAPASAFAAVEVEGTTVFVRITGVVPSGVQLAVGTSMSGTCAVRAVSSDAVNASETSVAPASMVIVADAAGPQADVAVTVTFPCSPRATSVFAYAEGTQNVPADASDTVHVNSADGIATPLASPPAP